MEERWIDDTLSDLAGALHALRRMQRRSDEEEDLEYAVWIIAGAADRIMLSQRRMIPARAIVDPAALDRSIAAALRWTYPGAERAVIPFPTARLAGDAPRIARAALWGMQALLDAEPVRITVSLLPPRRGAGGGTLRITARMADPHAVRAEPDPVAWNLAATLAAALGGTLAATISGCCVHLTLRLPDSSSAAAPGKGILSAWPVWWTGAAPPPALVQALRALGSQSPCAGTPESWPSAGVLIIGPGSAPAATPPGVLRIRWGPPEGTPASGELWLDPGATLLHLVQRIGMAARLVGRAPPAAFPDYGADVPAR